MMLRPRHEAPWRALPAAADAAPPATPPAAPMTPSRATCPQSTDPVVNFCTPMDDPALISAPEIMAAPSGPPTPVHITAMPATTAAPAAMYSQLSATHDPAAARALPRAPLEACW